MTKLIQAVLVTVGVILCSVNFQSSANGESVLTSSFSTGGIYTDNLAFSQTGKKEVVGISLTPSIGFENITADTIFGLRYKGVGQIFPDSNGDNRFIQNVASFLDVPWIRKNVDGLELRLIANLTFTPSMDAFGEFDQTDATELNPGVGGLTGTGTTGLNPGVSGVGGNVSGVPGVGNFGIQINRTNTLRSLAGATLRYPLTKKINFGGFYRNLNTVFLDQDEVTPDSNINTLEGSGTWQWWGSSTTTGNVRYALQPIISNISDTIIQNQITVGGTHLFTPSLVLDGRIGVNLIPEDPISALANVSLSQQFEGGLLSLRYLQGVGLAQGFADRATLTQVGTLLFSHALGERLNGYAQFSGARNISLSGNKFDLLAFGAGAGLTMVFLDWLSGGVNYNFYRQEKQGGTFGNDGERTWVNFYLTAFADPFRVFK
ncbi:MAG: hypothetical protein R3351_00050 [Nitrospirales bacterium]|nr:hypothetical protein [Nitrospirales bacterium]